MISSTAKNAINQVAGERLLTVKEAAQSLGLCVDSVRRHLRSGKLQGVRVGGGWRVPESKLALQLGLLTLATVPAAKTSGEHKAQKIGGDNELLDTLLETRPARVRVLELVEDAAIAADIPSPARAQLARELNFSLSAHRER